MRGVVQVTPSGGLERLLLDGRQLRVKLGIDPTAPDIHLGFAVVLRKLRQFQDAGHTAVLIIGDFTAKVGDPSGRSKTRPVLSDAQITAHARTFRTQALKILRRDRLRVRRNSEWFGKFRPEDFLRLFSRVTCSQILARDDFQKRLAAGLSIGLHELLYPVLQGYDSVAVQADVELGGTDQTFNMLMGRDIQERCGVKPQVVLTMPLLVGLDGKQKMSKSLGNYIGVTEAPNDMYGKVMSLQDHLMEQYAALCTDLDWRTLRACTPMEAKQAIARAIVRIYHGEKAAARAAAGFSAAFQRGEFPKDAPQRFVRSGSLLLDVLVAQHILLSKSEARRKMREGAVQLDGVKVTDTATAIGFTGPAQQIALRVGKKKFFMLRRR